MLLESCRSQVAPGLGFESDEMHMLSFTARFWEHSSSLRKILLRHRPLLPFARGSGSSCGGGIGGHAAVFCVAHKDASGARHGSERGQHGQRGQGRLTGRARKDRDGRQGAPPARVLGYGVERDMPLPGTARGMAYAGMACQRRPVDWGTGVWGMDSSGSSHFFVFASKFSARSARA